jgi:hypothetical protein
MHLKNTIISMELQKKWRFFVMGVMICLDLMGMWWGPYFIKSSDKTLDINCFMIKKLKIPVILFHNQARLLNNEQSLFY